MLQACRVMKEGTMSQEEKSECTGCETAASAVVKWREPVFIKTVRNWFLPFVGGWVVVGSAAGFFLAVASKAHDGFPWSWQGGFFALICVVGSLLLVVYTWFVGVFFWDHFLPGNVFAKNRGIYLFLDKDKRLHRHLELPIATDYAPTPAVIGIGVGWWFRKTVCYGAPWQNWKVVDGSTFHNLVVEDRQGCQLPGISDQATVLAHVVEYVSVSDIIMREKRNVEALATAFDKLGVGVRMVISVAIASKDTQRSPMAMDLRERLERLLESLTREGHLPSRTLCQWNDEATRLLAERGRQAVAAGQDGGDASKQ